MSDGVDQRVEVESRQIHIFGADIDHCRNMIPRDSHWQNVDQIVVQERERDSVLSTNWRTDYHLVDVIKLYK